MPHPGFDTYDGLNTCLANAEDLGYLASLPKPYVPELPAPQSGQLTNPTPIRTQSYRLLHPWSPGEGMGILPAACWVRALIWAMSALCSQPKSWKTPRMRDQNACFQVSWAVGTVPLGVRSGWLMTFIFSNCQRFKFSGAGFGVRSLSFLAMVSLVTSITFLAPPKTAS